MFTFEVLLTVLIGVKAFVGASVTVTPFEHVTSPAVSTNLSFPLSIFGYLFAIA